MEYIVHRINLDIHSTQSQVTLRVKRGDTKRKIYISLREGGLPYEIAEDCTAVLSASKPDGNSIYNNCQIKDNKIIYTFTDQTAPVAGIMDCEIILKDSNGNQITSPHFTIVVEEGVFYGDEIISTTETNALEALINRATDATNRAEELVNEGKSYFANSFKATKSGSVVQLDDVSPVEHIVGCSLRCQNLYNTLLDYVKISNSEWTYDAENNILYVTHYYIHKYIALESGKTYTLSWKSTTTGGNGGGVYIRAYSKEKTEFVTLNDNKYFLSGPVTFTMPKGYSNLRITFYGDTADNPTEYSATYTEIMVEEGNKATEYIPYVDVSTVKVLSYGTNPDEAEEYAVNEDGTVEGITSLSPGMTIYTDTAGTLVEVEYNRDSNKVYMELFDSLWNRPEEDDVDVPLLASAWVATDKPNWYEQIVEIEGVTPNTQVDLKITDEQAYTFRDKDLAFIAKNKGGVVTVVAIGQKPTNDYTLKANLREV